MAYSMVDGPEWKKKGGSVKKTVRNFFSGAYHKFGDRPEKSVIKETGDFKGGTGCNTSSRRRHHSAEDKQSKQNRNRLLPLASKRAEDRDIFRFKTLWPSNNVFGTEGSENACKKLSASSPELLDDANPLDLAELNTARRNSADVALTQNPIEAQDEFQPTIDLPVLICEQERRHSTGSGWYRDRHKLSAEETCLMLDVDQLSNMDDSTNNVFTGLDLNKSLCISTANGTSQYEPRNKPGTISTNDEPAGNIQHMINPSRIRQGESSKTCLTGHDTRNVFIDSSSSLATANLDNTPTTDKDQDRNKMPMEEKCNVKLLDDDTAQTLSSRIAINSGTLLGDEEFLQRSRDRFIRQISYDIAHNIVKEDSFGSDVVSYLQNVSDETRSAVAQYLSSGNSDNIQLTLDNLHDVFHVASTLNIKQLISCCLKFCTSQSQPEVISCFGTCRCKKVFELESKQGYSRSQSIISITDNSQPPEYFIVFSKTVKPTDKNKVQKVNVIVIDMSVRLSVYRREMDKPYQFGNGFQCCSCRIQDSPYVAVSGGQGKGDNLWIYDVLMNTWRKCAKMTQGRSKHVMCYRREFIYVLGGEGKTCIERYNIKQNKWKEIASLSVNVHSAICVKYQTKIYLFGGKTPAGAVSTVQCFDTETNTVKKLQDLPCPIYAGQGVVLDDHIYIASGQGHMIKFDPETANSHLCSQQPVERKHFGMFVRNDRIYLVGGVISDDDIDSQLPQYRYNPDKDTWVEKHKMESSFPVYASCIIRYPKRCSVVPFSS